MDEDEHIKARGLIAEVEVPCSDGRKVRQLGSPFKLSECPVLSAMLKSLNSAVRQRNRLLDNMKAQ